MSACYYEDVLIYDREKEKLRVKNDKLKADNERLTADNERLKLVVGQVGKKSDDLFRQDSGTIYVLQASTVLTIVALLSGCRSS